MLAYPIAALLLLGSSATAATGGRKKLMSEKQFHKDLYGSSKRSAALRKKFISKSTVVGGRKLEDSNNYDNWYNNQGNYNYNANANQYQEDEDYDAEAEAYNYEMSNNEYGFEPSNYALSYHRCAAVQQFDDEVASRGNTNTAFATKNFAIFRFCPVETCDAAQEEQDQYNYQYNYQQGGGRRGLQYNYQYQGEEVEQNRYQDNYGARGSGCNKNYGEYMIEIEDYLQIMKEHQEERGELFCEYCEEYMYELYTACLNSGNCRRGLKYQDFKDPNGFHGRMLGIDYGLCTAYPDVCNGAVDDSLTEYFECKEVGGAYVGPHCAEDGITITLGVFADEDCNVYTGGSVQYVLGEALEEDALKKWYNSKHGTLDVVFAEQEGQEDALCIPCEKIEESFDIQDYEDDDAGGNNNADEAEGDGEMSELCEALFMTSARCHKNYRNFRKGNLSNEQWKEMQLSCSFIDSIATDNYDEMGYVQLKDDWNYRGDEPQWIRDNKYASDYVHAVSEVSPLQVFFLIFSILACAILAVWSKTLHTSMTKTSLTKTSLPKKDEPWAPGRKWNMGKVFQKKFSPGISPADSGIGANRVRSNDTYYLS